MLAELKAANPELNIEILGINAAADAPFNSLVTQASRLAWLQDTEDQKVRDRWAASWRDVRIVDGQNRLRGVANLFDYDLIEPANRALVKQLFLDAAKVVDSDKDGLPDDWEALYLGNLAGRPSDDADRDGADNFTEFALGTDPTDAKVSSSVKPALIRKEQRTLFAVPFRRRAGAFLDYVVESSPDLVRWTALGLEIEQPFQPLFDGTGTMSGSFALPRQDQGFGFMRIRALPKSSN